jgi:transketolase
VRKAFSDVLVATAVADPRVLLLTGDHGYALFDEFRHRCPSQYINAGIAEQNMVGVAAGLARSGFRPVVYALSAFIPVRVLEQIKLDVCCDRTGVLFIGDGAGVVYSTLGVSHQSTEDIAALRAIPNMRILSPGDPAEMKAAMELGLRTEGPVYLRMGKSDLGAVHASAPRLEWGKLIPVQVGAGPLVFIATGSMLKLAVTLAKDWPGSAVWSAPSLKPLDADAVVAACAHHRLVVTLEEHNVLGGLGGAVAEILSAENPRPVCRIGVPDRFARACGSYGHLVQELGLDLESVRTRVLAFSKKHQVN